MRLKHKVKIAIADKNGNKQEVLQCSYKNIPKRLLAFLLGEFCEVLVLKPGKTVQGIEIIEQKTSIKDSQNQWAKGESHEI